MRDETAVARNGAARNIPMLSVWQPVAGGLLAIILFAAIVGTAMLALKLDSYSRVIARLVGGAERVIVRAPVKDRPVELYVSPGEEVEAGQLLGRLDGADLDATIGQLTKQAVSARWRMRKIREKVSALLQAPGDDRAAAASRLKELRSETLKVEGLYRRLTRRISQTQKNMSQTDIRAPIAGRVELVAPGANDKLRDGGRGILRLVPSGNHIRIAGAIPQELRGHLSEGAQVRIVLRDRNGRPHPPFEAILTAIRTGSDVSAENPNKTLPQSFEIDIENDRIANLIDLHSLHSAEVVFKTGRASLLQQLIAAKL